MIKNYLKVAMRNLWRHRGFTTINVLGLATGIAAVLLILLYVKEEVSYDKHHVNRNHIYRLNIETTNPETGAKRARAIGPYRLAKELQVDFEEWTLVRFAPQNRELVQVGDERFVEDHLAFVDHSVFETFSFPLLEGTPDAALKDPFSVVMTSEVAERYFDQASPIGKVVQIRDRDYVVSGIMEAPPSRTQFDFDILVSMESGEQVFSTIVRENWGEGYVETFAMLPSDKQPADYASRLAEFVGEKLAVWERFSPELIMQGMP
ncbi:MAG: ABC transporter permease, partial [Saprospiraceae bacterium]|nr:ABC transporter permease [Saprospiraceae bacterium]